jgi:aspartate 1-decarboxylase
MYGRKRDDTLFNILNSDFMHIGVLKSKVHRAVITEANLHYVGSLTLDEDLMDAANFIENERV